jgi:transposase-like protein
MNLRRIGRHLGVHHQNVANWAKAYAEKLPAALVPEKVENAEMDEVFTFIGDKKQNLHNHYRRSKNSLYFRLGSGLGTNPRSHLTHGR